MITPLGLRPTTYHCKVPDGVVPADVIPPRSDNNADLIRCGYYQNFSTDTNITVRGCPLGWEYSDEVHSIVHEVGSDVIHVMSAMASQNTGVMIVYPTICPCADQRKHHSSAPLALVRGIRRWPVNYPHKGPVTQKTFPFDYVIMRFVLSRAAVKRLAAS